MQNDFVMPGGALVVADAAGTIPAIPRLLALARAEGVGGFFTQDPRDRGGPEKTRVENIIGRNTVKTVTVDEAKGTVDVTFESATYPPAARATMAGEVLPKQLDRLTPGARITKGQPLVYGKGPTGAEVVGGSPGH